MKRTMAAALVAAVALALHLLPSPVHAQPRVTEANPEDGAVLSKPPEVLRLCFSEPVRSQDSADWKFNVLMPEGPPLGLRIVFQSDGSCVEVFPGLPQEPPAGQWRFEWLVRSQASGDEASGTVHFEVVGTSAEATPGASPGATPQATPGAASEGEGDGADILPVVLVAAGVAGAAAVLALVLWRARRRRGSGRRPPSGRARR